MTTDTAALPTKINKRRALLALIKLADEEACWLEFTDQDGHTFAAPPEKARELADDRHYVDKQECRLISPLDVISDAADELQRAHAKFQGIRIHVMAWYDRRRELDRQRDQKEHGDG